ncbi:hypothetical protein L1987_24440 [Smallanthus sonchifolius]|uniref:Uncharacterized protein n=1 Tax=Smallanthus sonchifolius TaxID=185202 RepID=A0ACB9IKM6_9ASTR|nr:hypothetical protein L1987_24440 [Smallanthus sonchifolius]
MILLGGFRSYSFTFWHQCIYWTKFVSTYQENAAHKFVGSSIPNARSYVEAISSAKNSEEAPWLGRKTQSDDVVPEKPYQVICHIFSGRSRGFGFVTMSSVEEFEEVVCKFYGYELHGRALRVNLGPALPWTDESPFG